MQPVPFSNQAVKKVFDSYSEPERSKLMALRELIFETASELSGVGALEETLKWGQPSYLTTETGSGSTIRIDRIASRPGQYAMYFICRTSLIDTFRSRFPQFSFEGDRSIIFRTTDDIPTDALKICIALALTYHLGRRKT